MLLILNVIFVLVAIAMIVLILMQRGAGAQAGSGFGGGASATVFGARGSANFLSKATKWLATAFFVITFFMAWQATQGAPGDAEPDTDLGLMSEVPAAQQSDPVVPVAPEAPAPEVPEVPAVEQTDPVVPAASEDEATPAGEG